MKQVGITQLKNSLTRYLRAAQAGETIEVTDHGRPIARLVPTESNLPLVIRQPTRPFSEVTPKRHPAVKLSVSSLDLLMEERGKR